MGKIGYGSEMDNPTGSEKGRQSIAKDDEVESPMDQQNPNDHNRKQN